MDMMSTAPAVSAGDPRTDPVAAFVRGLQVGADMARQTELLECRRWASERVDVYGDSGRTVLLGAEYACGRHVVEVAAAVAADGYTAVAGRCGEFEPPHLCGQVVSYVGGVAW